MAALSHFSDLPLEGLAALLRQVLLDGRNRAKKPFLK